MENTSKTLTAAACGCAALGCMMFFMGAQSTNLHAVASTTAIRAPQMVPGLRVAVNRNAERFGSVFFLWDFEVMINITIPQDSNGHQCCT